MSYFIADTLRVVRADAALIGRYRMLRLAVVAVALEPAVYALICLSSLWDPVARTSAMPVALVNLDAGVRYRDQDDNVGRELGDALLRKGLFGWRLMADAQAARQAVSAGEMAFAVIIPADFSAQAVPGAVAGGGEIRVILSEGNNYAAAGLAKHFAEQLGHQVNETLNEKRWTLVLSSAKGTQNGLDHLKASVKQLRAGATALASGAAQYSVAATALSGGVRQLGDGVRAMEARLPDESDLKALTAGSRQMIAGHHELLQGLEPLQTGAFQLARGARQMQEQSDAVPFFGGKLARGAGELATGAMQLGDGLGRVRSANERLAHGVTQLDGGITQLVGGITQLVGGMGQLGHGLHTLATNLPTDQTLDDFAAGGKSLTDGAGHLLEGLKRLDAALPATSGKPDGNAQGLAGSVKPVLENMAPVLNNGSAYAPNMVALALWIGAVMAGYLFNLAQMPASLVDLPRSAKAVGKFLVPAAVTLVQALLACGMLVFGLGLQAPSALNLLLTMAVTALVFLAMLFALLRVFGEAGKLLSVLFLTLQLSAGGGVIPIELSGGMFQMVHDWLPFTWVIKAFRASLFGAYDHGWLSAMRLVVLAGGVSLLLATFVGRWRFVPDAEHRPGIET